ncbi:putative pentatricopeptide repeat-containing protein At1g56570 [Lycium ferocissimum]|uniref:putative pentatricopeptide repeat-containing protein At1g56570 n=1 Tax=Lycium ferocissimum TaxID=112874 RepID=UPI002814C70B|nr:putative pentatricopeptide repeat-containing protein At1g56570 [Lycium ferocissimum]
MHGISLMNFLSCAKYGIFEANFYCPVLQCQLPTTSSSNRVVVLRSELSLPNTKRNNGVIRSKMLETSVSSEATPKTQVQKLVDLLHVCAKEELLNEAKAIHGYILKSNISDNNLLLLLNHVSHAYLRCSDFSSCQVLFDKMSQKNVFSWTVMIVGSIENGFFYDGFKYFHEMLNYGVLPDGFAYSAALRLCIALGSLELGKMVHAQIVMRGFTSNVVINTSLLNMYAKLGNVKDSSLVFNSMSERNAVSWNAIISGLTANGLHLEAFNHFLEMKNKGLSPDVYTLVGVMKAVGRLGDIGKGKVVHSCVCELGLESNVVVGTALIDMYAECGALCEARAVFNSNFTNCGANMPWNSMISGCVQCKCSQEALELHVNMCKKNVTSDIYTYCSLFDAIAELKCSKFLREVHAAVLKSEYDCIALSVQNAIADAYAKCGSLEDVRKILDRMEHRDIVSWTTLVTAYSQDSQWQAAIAVFSQMREEGFVVNQYTLASILAACASLCYLEYGRQLHGLLYKTGLQNESCTESALVDMYAKCGSIIEAEKVFGCISNADAVSWTAMISGYAQHGSVFCALELFKKMEELGIKPTAVTLLCILFACSHGGLVKEGLRFFWSMGKRYNLVPEMQHYACVVDLLGRVGLLSEAFEFIRKMPVEPGEMVWQSLLSACRLHGDSELGEIAAKKILSVHPQYSATYVLLSNTYMETGKFREGIDLRNVMKKQGVRKEPGYSWITINEFSLSRSIFMDHKHAISCY